MKQRLIFKLRIARAILATTLLILGLNKAVAQIEETTFYGDLIMTPMMAYTITPKGSNIPTHFLVANGIKANIGFEIGLITPVFTTADDARAFIAAGMSRHFLGFDYGGNIINLGEQRISNHRHNRWFFGLKFIPFEKTKFFTISATAGYGNVVANYASKNINGKIKARSGDISISFSFGLNKFVFQ
jgi:hypothetical protein